jgi:hypothetical protein
MTADAPLTSVQSGDTVLDVFTSIVYNDQINNK